MTEEKTPRDEFAMAALGAIVDKLGAWSDEKVIAIRAWQIADAMLEERKKGKTK